jgi:AdoMet-dependent rRNA methyltransferase SPB1
MSDDELAEVLAVSRKMLRKKSRQAILEMVYDKTGFGDTTNLPKWFTEDEKKHMKKIPMVTKEEVAVRIIRLRRNALQC